MGWCDDVNHFKYNCLIKINKKIKHEKLYRTDHKYDFLIPINYNTNKPKRNKGSAIFLHLTKNYKNIGLYSSKKRFFNIVKINR